MAQEKPDLVLVPVANATVQTPDLTTGCSSCCAAPATPQAPAK